MINDLIILDRKEDLFLKDMNDHDNLLNDIVKNASFLVIGAAGSIGQAVTKEIIKRNWRNSTDTGAIVVHLI